MRILAALSLFVLGGCNWGDSAHRDDRRETPGEAAGHAAYVVQKDAKKAAKEIGKDLKSFGHDAREGFEKEKQKDLGRKKVQEKEPK